MNDCLSQIATTTATKQKKSHHTCGLVLLQLLLQYNRNTNILRMQLAVCYGMVSLNRTQLNLTADLYATLAVVVFAVGIAIAEFFLVFIWQKPKNEKKTLKCLVSHIQTDTLWSLRCCCCCFLMWEVIFVFPFAVFYLIFYIAFVAFK